MLTYNSFRSRLYGLVSLMSGLVFSLHTAIDFVVSIVAPTVEYAISEIVATAHSFKTSITGTVRKVTSCRVSTAANHVTMLRSIGPATA